MPPRRAPRARGRGSCLQHSRRSGQRWRRCRRRARCCPPATGAWCCRGAAAAGGRRQQGRGGVELCRRAPPLHPCVPLGVFLLPAACATTRWWSWASGSRTSQTASDGCLAWLACTDARRGQRAAACADSTPPTTAPHPHPVAAPSPLLLHLQAAACGSPRSRRCCGRSRRSGGAARPRRGARSCGASWTSSARPVLCRAAGCSWGVAWNARAWGLLPASVVKPGSGASDGGRAHPPSNTPFSPSPLQELEKFEKLAGLPPIPQALGDKYSCWDAGESALCVNVDWPPCILCTPLTPADVHRH